MTVQFRPRPGRTFIRLTSCPPPAALARTAMPRVIAYDRYDYPKKVRWTARLVTLERVWALADRPCDRPDCTWTIASHTFYVKLYDHKKLRTIGRLSVPTTHDFHPGCLPPELHPALTRLEVPA